MDEVDVSPLERAISKCGWRAIASACGVSTQAVRKWLSYRRLPQSEFSGVTNHSGAIEAVTSKEVTKSELLEWSREGWKRPAGPPAEAQAKTKPDSRAVM